MEAFGGSPGVHKGLVKSLLATLGQLRDPSNVTRDKKAKAEEEVGDAVKVALLIRGAVKRRYGKLKDQLANFTGN